MSISFLSLRIGQSVYEAFSETLPASSSEGLELSAEHLDGFSASSPPGSRKYFVDISEDQAGHTSLEILIIKFSFIKISVAIEKINLIAN